MSTPATNADGDGDSRMTLDSGVLTPDANAPILSPPSSQTREANSSRTLAMANANGKRPLNTISNGHDEDENHKHVDEDDGSGEGEGEEAEDNDSLDERNFLSKYGSNTTSAAAKLLDANVVPQQSNSNSQQTQEFPTKTHAASGYKWSRAADEPGASWTSKKAVDEMHRAVDSMVHRDSMVRGRYGDPFEAADRERALLENLKRH